MTTDATSALRALLRQVYGMAREGCESPAAAYRWCERIDEVLHEARASDEYEDHAADLPPALEAALTADAADGVRVPRYFASGPEGSFFTDDALFAETLLQAADRDRDDWTITDLAAPTAEGTRTEGETE